MEFCDYIDEWSADESMVKIQLFLDAVIAMAHFFVPLELIYFVFISPIFPHKLLVIYFRSFIILCGAKYVTNLWRYSQYSETSTMVIVIVQICATAASWLTVVVLYFVMPHLLCPRKSEHLLKYRVEELSGEKSFMLCEVATRKSVARLIDDIRSTLDWKSVIKSTIVGLGEIFDLEECSFWFPSQTNKTLWLSHSLYHLISAGSAVPISLPVVAEIFNNIGAVRIPYTCPLVRPTQFTKRGVNPEAVAIRVSLVDLSFNESDESLNVCAMSYAVIVLVLPSENIRQFRDYELELLAAVAEQVSVALVHASAFEESTMACDHLQLQNDSMEVALRDMAIAFRASNDLKIGIFYQIEMPLQALVILSSFLLETTLTTQQMELAETVLRCSSTLEILMQNERDLTELQHGSIGLNLKAFNLPDAIEQVVNKIKPAAAVKRLSVSLVIDPSLPVYALGDQERLMQVILNIMGNAVKFTREGHISVTASVANPETTELGSLLNSIWCPVDSIFTREYRHSRKVVFCTVLTYRSLQVEDSGCGIDPKDIPNLFHPPSTLDQDPGAKLGLPICKRLLEAMEGCIWVESDGLDKGSTATFIVKLGLTNSIGSRF